MTGSEPCFCVSLSTAAVINIIIIMVLSISLEGYLLSERMNTAKRFCNGKIQLSSHQGLMGWLKQEKILKWIPAAFIATMLLFSLKLIAWIRCLENIHTYSIHRYMYCTCVFSYKKWVFTFCKCLLEFTFTWAKRSTCFVGCEQTSLFFTAPCHGYWRM